MEYITPDYLTLLPEGAPVVTKTVGAVTETAVSLSTPGTAACILPRKEGIRYSTRRDGSPAAQIPGVDAEQTALLTEAYHTMDLILHDRTEPLRTDLLLAFTYGMEFDPMLSGGDRYAYEELDWGYTEQPYRQLSCLTPLQGRWDLKQAYLVDVLKQLRAIALPDNVLAHAFNSAIELFENIDDDAFETMRNALDGTLEKQDYLFENLLVMLLHSHWLDDAAEATVVPCIKRMACAFAALRAFSAVIVQAKGGLTDELFQELAVRYIQSVDEGADEALRGLFAAEPVFEKTALERMLWR